MTLLTFGSLFAGIGGFDLAYPCKSWYNGGIILQEGL